MSKKVGLPVQISVNSQRLFDAKRNNTSMDIAQNKTAALNNEQTQPVEYEQANLHNNSFENQSISNIK